MHTSTLKGRRYLESDISFIALTKRQPDQRWVKEEVVAIANHSYFNIVLKFFLE